MDNQKSENWHKRYYETHCKNNEDYKKRKAAYTRKRRRELRHPCPICGTLIDYRAKLCRRHSAEQRKGENHYNWKGGRRIERGYVLVQMPNHPRAMKCGYVREHFIVWEQVHQRPIPQGWIIHHINGVKSDNRSTNLVALPSKKHNKLIALKEKRIQELEALLNGQYQLL